MREYPGRPSHEIPSWVPEASTYHIRIRKAPASPPLLEQTLAPVLLQSARHYHSSQRWNCRLFLLMPDHLHAILEFGQESAMTRIVGDWKAFHSRHTSIEWQEGFFDYRIRNPHDLDEKCNYIRMNPVVKGLCTRPEDWPWVIECVD